MCINIPFSTLMYIACLCPNLVSVHFHAIPIYTSNFIFYWRMRSKGYSTWSVSLSVCLSVCLLHYFSETVSLHVEMKVSAASVRHDADYYKSRFCDTCFNQKLWYYLQAKKPICYSAPAYLDYLGHCGVHSFDGIGLYSSSNTNLDAEPNVECKLMAFSVAGPV